MGDVERYVTAVVVNYQTPDLTEQAVTSLRSFYPDLPLLLIDNGSKDRSVEVLKLVRDRWPASTRFLCNDRNLYHGPAMHQALQLIETEFALFLDSDCEVTKGGLLERMLHIAQGDELCYAVGKKVHMNKRGFNVSTVAGAIPYVRPVCMLLGKKMYSRFSPFTHHGTPCLDNMRDAVAAGLHLIDFPVSTYVTHRGRGTADRYGYGLGLRGKVNYILQKLGL